MEIGNIVTIIASIIAVIISCYSVWYARFRKGRLTFVCTLWTAIGLEIKEVLKERFKPDGFNIGINIGDVARQTINHVHIHLIPRYKGDIDEHEGGVRGVIPEKRKYK